MADFQQTREGTAAAFCFFWLLSIPVRASGRQERVYILVLAGDTESNELIGGSIVVSCSIFTLTKSPNVSSFLIGVGSFQQQVEEVDHASHGVEESEIHMTNF